MDIFDILGPVMVGPSSSHTAGAVRIGSMARTLLGTAPKKAAIHLYGSFADTGLGHGTDRALVAGLLGMKPDDLRIPYAFEAAKKQDLHYTIELRDAHPNTAVIEVWDKNDKYLEMQASSLGGGRIMDFSKAVAEFAGVGAVNIPTSMSTCAPFTCMSVMYTPRRAEKRTAGAMSTSWTPVWWTPR